MATHTIDIGATPRPAPAVPHRPRPPLPGRAPGDLPRRRLHPRERNLWAANHPDEPPLVNGEFEWIALNAE